MSIGVYFHLILSWWRRWGRAVLTRWGRQWWLRLYCDSGNKNSTWNWSEVRTGIRSLHYKTSLRSDNDCRGIPASVILYTCPHPPLPPSLTSQCSTCTAWCPACPAPGARCARCWCPACPAPSVLGARRGQHWVHSPPTHGPCTVIWGNSSIAESTCFQRSYSWLWPRHIFCVPSIINVF